MTDEKTENTEQKEEKNEEEEEEEEEAKEKPQGEEKAEETSAFEAQNESDSQREKKEEKPEPSGKFKDLIKEIESLSVLELAELVKELENRFGVSAIASVASAVPGGASTTEEGSTEEEKTEFNVILKNAGDQKINVIKVVREITQLGLKDAKDLVDAAPKEIKTGVKKEEAEEIKKKLEDIGAEVELK